MATLAARNAMLAGVLRIGIVAIAASIQTGRGYRTDIEHHTLAAFSAMSRIVTAVATT